MNHPVFPQLAEEKVNPVDRVTKILKELAALREASTAIRSRVDDILGGADENESLHRLAQEAGASLLNKRALALN